MTHRILLAKILPARFTQDFLDGDLYLNTNKYFGSVDRTDTVRFDPHDGVDEALQVQEVAVQDDLGSWLPIEGVLSPITVRFDASEALNILCLYTMTDREGDEFDERNATFGDVTVVISNTSEFIRRVRKASSDVGKNLSHGAIQYVNRNSHHGTMGPFTKFAEHKFQNEFRLVLGSGDGKACRLSIGTIQDITIVIPTKELQKFWNSCKSMGA